jgi:hypothetical protein
MWPRKRELLFVVNLYQNDTSLVVLADDDRAVPTGKKADRDCGFQIVARSESVALPNHRDSTLFGNQGAACKSTSIWS